MTRKIIAVDCDLTVVDTGRAHWEWLCEKTGKYMPFPTGCTRGGLPYNLGEMFGIPVTAMEFWRSETLYDDLLPIEDSVNVLRELSKEYDIIFCSQHKGNHPKSKCYFLKAHFPFNSGIVLTKEKQYTRCDYLIDDRLNHLESMFPDVVTIQYNTIYKQSSDFEPDYKVNNWLEVKELFEKL